MGSVADKIAKRIISSGRSKVVDLAAWKEGKEMVRNAGIGDDLPALGNFSDLNPCHALYVFGQNVVSLIAKSISGMREAKGFARIAGDAEDEYMPAGPPISPLTVSYFTMWALFDIRFGSSRETMGSCVQRLGPEFDCPAWLMDGIARMQQSRMGFYVHCGRESDRVLLREVGTREVFSCTVPAGYAGQEGQIWFARVLPPPNRSCRWHIVFTTPYVIRDYPEFAFIQYLERELERMAGKMRSGQEEMRENLLKFGPDPNHWNEYIFCAYSNYQPGAIFLTGIPDIRESLPHASTYR